MLELAEMLEPETLMRRTLRVAEHSRAKGDCQYFRRLLRRSFVRQAQPRRLRFRSAVSGGDAREQS